MNEKVLLNATQVCEELKITKYTLSNWYNWERLQLRDGIIKIPKLPKPLVAKDKKGKPRMWTQEMLEELKNYQKGIIMGRNGSYGKYSNPYYKETKKYKKATDVVETN